MTPEESEAALDEMVAFSQMLGHYETHIVYSDNDPTKEVKKEMERLPALLTDFMNGRKK